MLAEERVAIDGEDGTVAARQRARETARALGFSPIDQARVATAVSELARNVVRYAADGRGEVLIRALLRDEGGAGIEIVVRDDGPGIADLAEAMRPGFTSGPGLGMGLPGTRRLMDDFAIESRVGRGRGCGTTVTIRKWRR